jgi:hypothetical protein
MNVVLVARMQLLRKQTMFLLLAAEIFRLAVALLTKWELWHHLRSPKRQVRSRVLMMPLLEEVDLVEAFHQAGELAFAEDPYRDTDIAYQDTVDGPSYAPWLLAKKKKKRTKTRD